jgi:hypothetical protein
MLVRTATPVKMPLMLALLLAFGTGLVRPVDVLAGEDTTRMAGLANSSQGEYITGSESFRLRDRAFEVFMDGLAYTTADLPVGLYVPGLLALPVVQQPAGNPAYVSPADGEVTHFGLAAGYGSTGLLAHNTAAGAQFDDLNLGQVLYLVDGTHRVQAYRVTQIRRLRALQPSSPYSEFLDLDIPGVRLTAADLFYQVYSHDGRLVLQTCIEAEGKSNWGRLFLIAEPVEPGDFYQAESVPLTRAVQLN